MFRFPTSQLYTLQRLSPLSTEGHIPAKLLRMAPQYLVNDAPWLRPVFDRVTISLHGYGSIYRAIHGSVLEMSKSQSIDSKISNMKYYVRTGLTGSLALVTSISNALPYHHPRQSDYPGWANIETMFIFGDSYTSTGFNLSLDQPNPANPLGNPAYPGYTSSNGPNWIDFLTTTYNASQISTINLAYGGATIDSSLVAPYLTTVLSVVQQVQDEFLPSYTPPSNALFSWTPRTTLFGIWIGINDINNSYSSQNSSSLFPKIFAVYANLLDQLYVSGARNFLLLNVPPVDRSPGTVALGPSLSALSKQAIADWNARLTALSKNLTTTYPDSKTFLVDTNAVFNKVIDSPCSFPQTCAYKNTTDYCDVYANEDLTSWYEFNASCGVSVDEYFWLNTLHPTFRVHNATAAVVARHLA